MLILLKVAIIY